MSRVNKPRQSGTCPSCGLPESEWMGGLCPVCLLGWANTASDFDDMFSAASSRWSRGSRLGDYEILEPIARGGMGDVYRARQARLNREVAVKVLLGGAFAGRAFLQRFQREAEAAASLSHPNIVSIFEVGDHEGQPFFSMELIDGQNLADVIRDHRPSVDESVRLLKTLAEAVRYAHEHGILHRDLKPSNILVDRSGQPHITDFGLARRVEENSELTLPGQVIGSPNYVAPEQARGATSSLGPAVDIYSLGAVLYHLLTGRPPYLADTVAETLRLAVDTEPVSPRLLNPSVSRDLETLCLKCLEKSPERRYASARQLAEELSRVIRKEPIQVRPVSRLEGAYRWCRRKPALASAVGAIVLLTTVVVIGGWLVLLRIQRERDVARWAERSEAALRSRAQRAEQDARGQLYEALLGEARATVRSGELGQKIQTLEAVSRAAGFSNSIELRREALAALGLPDLRFRREIEVDPTASCALLDPEFSRMAVGRGTNGLEISSLTDSHQSFMLRTHEDYSPVSGRWSHDGRYLGIRLHPKGTSSRAVVQIWDLHSRQQVRLFPATPFGAFAFDPSRPRILVDNGDASVTVWDLEKKESLGTHAIPGMIHHLEFSTDGRSFVVQHRVVRPWFTSIYNTDSGQVLQSRITAWVDSLSWDPLDRWVAAGARNGEVYLYDRKTEKSEMVGRLKNSVRSLVFTPDGQFLFAGSEEREIILWDLRTRRRVMTIRLSGLQMGISRDGRHWATRTRSGVRLYQPELETPCQELVGDLGHRLRYAAFSPNARWLAASGLSRIGVWDLQAPGSPVFPLEAEHAIPSFSPDGLELFAHSSRRAERWRLGGSSGGESSSVGLQPIPLPEVGRVFSAQYTTNRLILGTESGFLMVPRNQQLAPTSSPYLGFRVGSVSPLEDFIAARKYREIEVYRLQDWQRFGVVEVRDEVLSHTFTPDGRELVIASEAGVSFFHPETLALKRRLVLPLGKGGDLIFAPSGKCFWVAQDSMEASLYDTRTLKPLVRLPWGCAPRALSSDNGKLAVVIESERLQVWDLPSLRKLLAEQGVDWAEGAPSKQGQLPD